jgi:hypothetical protein
MGRQCGRAHKDHPAPLHSGLIVEPGADVVGSKNWSELEFPVLA